MTDNLPGHSGFNGAGKPLTRTEFIQRERARKALDIWIETQSYAQVRQRLKLRSNDAARDQVLRGEEIWRDEEQTATTRHIAAQTTRMYQIISQSREANTWTAIDREMKAWERLSKLLGLDARPDTDTGGPQVIVQVGFPWERDGTGHSGPAPTLDAGDVIEGELVPPDDDPGSGGG